ncbi:MAG: apolipoprotein N-acyltransferase [Polyangiaceae bacterium]
MRAPLTRLARRHGRVLLAFAGGPVFATTSPPMNVALGVFAGLALFAASLDDRGWSEAPNGEAPGLRRFLVGSLRGWAFGMGANLVALRFVARTVEDFAPLPAPVGSLLLVLAAWGQGFGWAVGGAAYGNLVRVRAPRWLAFAGAVFVACLSPALFPWTPAGGLTAFPALLQTADLVGERGVSAIVGAIAALLAVSVVALVRPVARPFEGQARRTEALVPLVAATSVVLVLVLYGERRLRVESEREVGLPTARIGLVQPGIPARARWEGLDSPAILARLRDLTLTSEARGVDLTVWPEASYPYVVAHASRREPVGTRAMLQRDVLGPVLAGVILREGAEFVTNSVVLVRQDGTWSEPQDKRHLLLFGERVPFAESIPWIARTFARGTGMRAGSGVVAFDEGKVHAAVLNCFEDLLPEAGRELGAVEPNLLVNVTNDAWFVGTMASPLHERIATLRAIEARRHFVRAVNRGPTSWIDATGRIRATWPGEVPGVLVATPVLRTSGPTPYVRFGDLPATLALAASVALFAFRRRKDAGSRTSAEPPSQD